MKKLYTYYFSSLLVGGLILIYGFFYYLNYFPASQLQIQSNEYIRVSFNAYLIWAAVLVFFIISLILILKIKRKSGPERKTTNIVFLSLSAVLVLFFGALSIYTTPDAYQHYKSLSYENNTMTEEALWPAQ